MKFQLPRRILTKEEKQKLTDEFITGLDEAHQNLVGVIEGQKAGVKKAKTMTVIFLLMALCCLVSTIFVVFFKLPVPPGMEIWALRGLTGASIFVLVGQNMMDGSFIRSFRMGRMKGKTLILIKRADNKWGWIFDNVRGGGVVSDIYGEFAISKDSMAALDGVACGVADDSEGITLPLNLTKIAQDLGVEGIGDSGTLDSLYNIEEKIDEYEKMQSELKDQLAEVKKGLKDDPKKDAPIKETIQQYQNGLENVENVLKYLKTIEVNHSDLITLNKKTLILKPFIDFFETYANNPIFKRTSRERAIAMEKAKAGRGENVGKIALYFSMVILAVGLCIYLIKTGTGESVAVAVKSASASIDKPQGIG